MKQPTIIKTLPIAILVALLATRYVHGRAGNETFMCEGVRCELGSSASWLLTGVTAVGPFIALAGFFWSRWLHRSDRLGPFSYRAIPDSEQILEVVGVCAAGLLTYWLALNGPSIEPVSIGRPNTWAETLRDFRLGEDATREQIENAKLVPSRRTWFLIGIILGGPFMFSFGSMLGREWYGRKRRKSQAADADETTSSSSVADGARSPDEAPLELDGTTETDSDTGSTSGSVSIDDIDLTAESRTPNPDSSTT